MKMMKSLSCSFKQAVVIVILFLNTSLMTDAGDCCGAPTLITNLCSECPPGSCACDAEDCVCPEIKAYGSWALTQFDCTITGVFTMQPGDSLTFMTPTAQPLGITLANDAFGSYFIFDTPGIYEISMGAMTKNEITSFPDSFSVRLGSMFFTPGGFFATDVDFLYQVTMLITVNVPNDELRLVLDSIFETTMCNSINPGNRAIIMLHLVDPNPPVPGP